MSTRLKVWSLLLLGTNYNTTNNNTNNLILPESECIEQHVLEADIKRTRADIDIFCTTLHRNNIQIILQTFCIKHSIQYKQGMNEVLAPFIYLYPINNNIPYNLFEAFLFRYLQRYYCIDSSCYLFKSFRLFNILLSYHDPQLALHLQINEFYPELYTLQWFLTLYARTLPLHYVLKLWDMFICIDDPAYPFFIGICLLCKHRGSLLLADVCSIPEIITGVGLKIEREGDVGVVVAEALVLHRKTPRYTTIPYLYVCICVYSF